MLCKKILLSMLVVASIMTNVSMVSAAAAAAPGNAPAGQGAAPESDFERQFREFVDVVEKNKERIQPQVERLFGVVVEPVIGGVGRGVEKSKTNIMRNAVGEMVGGGIDKLNAGELGGGNFDGMYKNFGGHFKPGGEGRQMLKDGFGAMGQESAGALNEFKEKAGLDYVSIEGFSKEYLWAMGPRYVGYVLAASAATAGGYYGTKALVDYIDRQIQRPALLMNYKGGMWQSFKNFFYPSKIEKVDMAFPADLEQKLQSLAQDIKETNKAIRSGKKNIYYSNLLLWGPPGTGKSMFAKKLAQESGMDFAEISGGSLSQFKDGKAITEVDNLFAWGKSCKNGLLIWIDEVDSLLCNRADLDGEDYKTANHILKLTGDESNNIIIVMTTNHKDKLDQAIFDRIGEMVEMPLPSQEYREKVLTLQINKLIFDEQYNGKQYVENAKKVLTPAKIAQIAQQTQGLSNRGLQHIVNKIRVKTIKADSIATSIVDFVVLDTMNNKDAVNSSRSEKNNMNLNNNSGVTAAAA